MSFTGYRPAPQCNRNPDREALRNWPRRILDSNGSARFNRVVETGLLSITWNILCESAIFILVGFAIAGLLHAAVAYPGVIRLLSAQRPRSVFLATLVGLPLPLCSCSVLPAAMTLRKRGASKGATLAFLISTPETSITSILLTYALLGPVMAIFRPIAAAITAFVAGIVENFADRHFPIEAGTAGEDAAACNTGAEIDAGDRATGFFARCGNGLRYAFVDLFDDIFGWILIGIVAAAAIQALLPAIVMEIIAANSFVSMLVMMVLGVPMYICAEASTPVAAAMVSQGLTYGAALVLLLVGPATNLGSLGVLYRQLGRRTVVIYLISICIVALALGAYLNTWIGSGELAGAAQPLSEPLVPGWIKTIGAVAFLLIGFGTFRRRRYLARSAAWLDQRLPVPVSRGGLVTALAITALTGYAFSGLFIVQPGETGIVRTFGTITRSDIAPGLHIAWPYPIDRVERVAVDRVYRTVLGYRADAVLSSATSPDDETDVGEAWVLVGDENIADLKSVVHWCARSEEVIHFAFRTRDRERLVRAAAAGALREVLGGESITSLFTTMRRAREAQICERIQHRLDAYEVGIQVLAFRFLDTHAPPDVHDAFRDVASALEDRDAEINRALTRQAQVVPLARGTAIERTNAARGYAAGTTANARGRAERFVDLLKVYEQYPGVTEQRLYLEMLERVLPGLRKYIKPAGEEARRLDLWLIGGKEEGLKMPWVDEEK